MYSVSRYIKIHMYCTRAVHGRGMAHTFQTTISFLCLQGIHPFLLQVFDLFEGHGNVDLARTPAHVGSHGHLVVTSRPGMCLLVLLRLLLPLLVAKLLKPCFAEHEVVVTTI